MRLMVSLMILASLILLTSCMQKDLNPDDPYEPMNRKIHDFNMAFDATMFKPPARLYKAVLPVPVRKSINNVFNNVNMIPTVINDLLQAEWTYAIKDTQRFLINSTLGIVGLFDMADEHFSLPPRSNDLGLTFAKWGDKKSPYIVLPLLGPSTIRDGVAAMIEYSVMTPYPYIDDNGLLYGLLGLRYIDLRSQWFETERLMDEALDKYTFIRDAYLQNRNYLINGEPEDSSSMYVDEGINGEGGIISSNAGNQVNDKALVKTEKPIQNASLGLRATTKKVMD